MTIATIYEHAELDYYDAMSDRCEFTRRSAEHDAALVEDVASKIRTTILEEIALLEREAHGDMKIGTDVAELTSCIMEQLGEAIDGPMCGLWHGMVRVLEAQPGKVAA